MKTSRSERDGSGQGSSISSVAAWLRSAREARGETLDDVARVTRIGKNYLEALEDGDLARLPSQAYIRGFIRLYAAHLDLSPETALAMMDACPCDPVDATIDPQPGPDHGWKYQPAIGRRLFIIVVATAVLGTAYFLFTKIPTGNTPTINRQIDIPPAPLSAPATTPPQPRSSQQGNAPFQPLQKQEIVDTQSIVLRLRAVSDGKITITIDDSFSQDYTLVTGDLVEWKAEDAIRLDLNNAASVEGELDGVKMAPFGEPGKGAHLVIKADGIYQE